MKAAGSSVELSLIKHCGEGDILTGDSLHPDIPEFQSRNNTFNFHTHSLPYMVQEKIEVNDYYKFSMVRNPWDAVVSYYWFAFTKSGKYKLSEDFSEVKSHFTDWLSFKSLYNWPCHDKPPLSRKEVFDCLVEQHNYHFPRPLCERIYVLPESLNGPYLLYYSLGEPSQP